MPSSQTAPLSICPILTKRERDVIRWSAEGKTVEDIGAILGISPHTVGEHLKNIRRKLGTLNAAHTVAVAIRLGELEIERTIELEFERELASASRLAS